MTDSFILFMENYQTRINHFLENYLSSVANNTVTQYAPSLVEAVHYSVLNGGKRIRPLLVYAGAHAIHSDNGATAYQEALDHAASAVEFIHCYSLVHDDLPAMDDDDMRRGKPTCHKQFDEATAILVGDALQTEAFNVLLKSPSSDEDKIKLIQRLAQASNINGLIGGQAMDLAATNQSIALEQLQHIHRLKTGALINSCLAMGGICAQANQAQMHALNDFSSAIGLAFQIQDDILDIEGNTHTLGKAQGSDISNNKATYPSLLGIQKAKATLNKLLNDAQSALQIFEDKADLLHQLANFIVQRNA